jgi:hypothetical protein
MVTVWCSAQIRKCPSGRATPRSISTLQKRVKRIAPIAGRITCSTNRCPKATKPTRSLCMRIVSIWIACIAIMGGVSAQATPPEFDIDGDGVCNATVDAAIAARYLVGFRGE